VLLLILLQVMLIIGLLWQRVRNRKTDRRLRESEERFRLMANTTPPSCGCPTGQHGHLYE